MICLICRQAETVNGLTSVQFERGEMKLTMNNLPARVCPRCGEAYVEEDIAVRLLQQVDEIYRTGILDETINFSNIHPAK